MATRAVARLVMRAREVVLADSRCDGDLNLDLWFMSIWSQAGAETDGLAYWAPATAAHFLCI